MNDWIQFLSGNVPGGIWLYLLLLFILFFIFYYFYRTSELFNARLFRRWWLGSWALLTMVYIILWMSSPPQQILKRYSLAVFAENQEDQWLAAFFRDELTHFVKPYQGRWHYFFPQQWMYYSDLSHWDEEEFFLHLVKKMPIQKVVVGKIRRSGGKTFLVLYFMKKGKTTRDSIRFAVQKDNLPFNLHKARQWVGRFLPIQEISSWPITTDSQLCLARDAFMRQDVVKSYGLYRKSLSGARASEHYPLEYFYATIRYAEEERKKAGPPKPFDIREPEWMKLNRWARQNLLQKLRSNLDVFMNDPFINTMIGESYLLEEKYGDAEIFLKNALARNPFQIEALENLAYLHPSRYTSLGFHNKEEIWEKILVYCPVYEQVLVDFSENMLHINPVYGEPPVKVRAYLKRYLVLNNRSAMGWDLIGKYYYLRLQNQKALKAFFTADSLQPRTALFQYNIGVVYHKMGRLEEAEKYFRKAIAYGDFLDAHLYLGDIYFQRRQYRKALAEFRYRVAHKKGENDEYAIEAMKGIRKCLEALHIPIPQAGETNGALSVQPQ